MNSDLGTGQQFRLHVSEYAPGVRQYVLNLMIYWVIADLTLHCNLLLPLRSVKCLSFFFATILFIGLIYWKQHLYWGAGDEVMYRFWADPVTYPLEFSGQKLYAKRTFELCAGVAVKKRCPRALEAVGSWEQILLSSNERPNATAIGRWGWHLTGSLRTNSRNAPELELFYGTT